MTSDLGPRQPLKRSSLRDQAYESIKEWIIRGRLSPGAKLVERVVAEWLGVSRAPVKDALLRLEREGFVVSKPDARYVKRFNRDELGDIYVMRNLLESKAAELAACNTSLGNASELDRAATTLREAFNRRDAVAFSDADVHIHQLIWTQAGNTFLQSTLDSIAAPTFMLITDYTRQTDHNWEFTLREHEDLVRSINSGDPERAARTMSDHVQRSFERGLAVLRASEDGHSR